jgi:ethanolamine utilization protein EutN
MRTEMQIGSVLGQAVCTVKHPTMKGWKLLVVQLLTAAGKEDGEPILAIDSLGAGVGHRVLLTNDGAAARQMVGHKDSPVRWMVLGICDEGL